MKDQINVYNIAENVNQLIEKLSHQEVQLLMALQFMKDRPFPSLIKAKEVGSQDRLIAINYTHDSLEKLYDTYQKIERGESIENNWVEITQSHHP